MTKLNNPNVKIFKGSVNKKIIGRIVIFMIPKISATIRAIYVPETTNPGKNHEATSMATVAKNQRRSNVIMVL